MSYEAFIDWICNDQGIPHDVVYGLTTISMSAPFFILTFFIFKKLEIELEGKNGCLFTLLVPIGFFIYLNIFFFLFLGSKNELLNFLGIIAYGPILFVSFFLPFSILGLFIFYLSSFFSKRKL